MFTSLLKSEKADGAYVELGQIYSMQGDYEDALKMHVKAVQLNPSVFNYNELAGCYKNYATKIQHEKSIFLSLLKQAVANYRESLKIYNEDEKVHCDLGFCLEKLGPASWNEAMRYYTNALTINPYHSLALKNRERLEDKMSQNQRGYAGNQNQRGSGRSRGAFFDSTDQRYQGSSSSSSSSNSNQNQRGRGRSQGDFFESTEQRYPRSNSSSSSSSSNSKRW